jgi:ArsR family transcriptional regulator
MRIGREPLGRLEAVEVAAMFNALSNAVRLRLFALIACHDDGEACVCDLIEAFEVSPPTISHHLKVLREAGLIRAERRGTWIYYSVDSVKLADLVQVLGGSAVEKPGVG